MRDIEFRGQQINTKKWVYGYLYRNKGLYVICENIRYAEEEPILLDTIGQYTGLKDRNGKKIFEGDIVAIEFQRATKRENAVISYLDKYASFVLTNTKEGKHEYQALGDYQMIFVEVIGNIYDNPELLKEEL